MQHIATHTHQFNGPFSGTTWVGWYQSDKINLDFTEARDSEWQWHQLGHMQVCTSLQADNHASTPPLSFLQAGRPSCCPTNSVKALKANATYSHCTLKIQKIIFSNKLSLVFLLTSGQHLISSNWIYLCAIEKFSLCSPMNSQNELLYTHVMKQHTMHKNLQATSALC